ncbi:MAG: M15 family metallopeptidase [Faecousia sp.]
MKRKANAWKWGCVCGVLVLAAVCAAGAFFHRKKPQEAFPQTQAPSTAATEATRIPQTTERREAEWNLLLVNPWNPLPEDFSVELAELKNGRSVDKRICQELQEMLADARAEGLSPVICSAYRTNAQQQMLYGNKIKRLELEGYSQEDAQQKAGTVVAVPGTSEHETGLALDIVAESYQVLTEDQENTAEQQWLMANAHRYGFILRYPKGKSEITGICYEPWHYRYVGKEAAKEIYEKGLCLEEYLKQ